ncbi:MAG: hypothetical protein N4A74_08440 [Carboxylicivirga sp.]|jgi:hypothetical protein|nr:hypothetical protein [Carboxylicivirga sp.]
MNKKALLYHLALLVFLFNYLNTSIQAQQTGPAAPDFMGFEPVDATDMVDLQTGDFTYTLPLMKVPGPEGGYPIVLSYKAGVGVGQEATWVGLGWRLNVGALNRSINETPDDLIKIDRTFSYYYVDKKFHTLNVTYGLPNTTFSLGVTHTWGDYNSTKGFVSLGSLSLNSDGNASASYAGISVNSSGNIGINPLSAIDAASKGQLSSSLSKLPFSPSMHFQHNISTGENGFSMGIQSYGLGLSMQSNSSGGSSIGFSALGNQLLKGQNITSTSVSTKQTTFNIPPIPIPTPIGKFFVSYRFNHIQKEKVSLDNITAIGTFCNYANYKFKQSTRDVIKLVNDISTMNGTYNEKINPKSLIPAYDQFIASSQGLALPFNYRYKEHGSLFSYGLYLRNNNQVSLSNIGASISNDVSSSNWEITQGNLEDPIEFGKFYYLDNDANNSLYHGNIFQTNTSVKYYDFTKNLVNASSNKISRNFGSSHIQEYTNKDIRNGSIDVGFIESTSIDDGRNNSTFYPDEGIGAFSITNANGMVYHYSLPVYQREIFVNREFDFTSNNVIDEMGSFNYQLKPYATNWLLTAITGPDYIDANNNNILDSDDYGYWVQFNYGKFSDGYPWLQGNILDEQPLGYDKKVTQYTTGFKDIFYLNSIQTATHTALFFKGERKDGIGYTLSTGFVKDYITEATIANENNINFRNRESIYAPSISHRILKLDKILLFKNENLPNIQQVEHLLNNSNYYPVNNNQIISKTYKESKYLNKFQLQRVKECTAPKTCTTTFPHNGSSVTINHQNLEHNNITKYNRTLSMNQMNNILDYKDFKPEFYNNALQVIEFDYSYDLMKGVANSVSSSKGKLTLKNITEKGRHGIQLKPSFQFLYNNSNDFKPGGFYHPSWAPEYNALNALFLQEKRKKEIEDSWGFYEGENKTGAPSNWSLKEIQSPLGSRTRITYEPDEIVNEYAYGSTLSLDISSVKKAPNQCGDDYFEDIYYTSWDVELREKINPDFFEVDEDYTLLLNFNLNENVTWNQPVSCRSLPIHSNTYEIMEFNKGRHTESFNVEVKSIDLIKNRIRISIDISKIKFFMGIFFHSEYYPEFFSDFNARIVPEEKIALRGGGIRVQEISITDGNSNYSTNYLYTDLNNKKSGVTSYIPINPKIPKYIPYIQLLPPPETKYKSVQVIDKSDGSLNHHATHYTYSYPSGCTDCTGRNYSLGNFLNISQDITPQHYNRKYYEEDWVDDDQGGEELVTSTHTQNEKYGQQVIENNTASIGLPKSIETFNNYKQILSSRTFEYSTKQNTPRIVESFFNTSKYGANVLTMLTKHVQYSRPNLVKSKSKSLNVENTTEYKDFDPLIGNPRTVITENSFGDKFRAESVYAHEIYPEMGSKHENPNYKNMLTQEAAAYLYKDNGNSTYDDDPLIDASVTTWKKDWNYRQYNPSTKKYETSDKYPNSTNEHVDIWRKHTTYSLKSMLNPSDGSYIDDGLFDFNNLSANTNWVQNSEVTMYDHYSNAIESKDVNGNYLASKQWEHKTTSSVVGANYTTYCASGMEELKEGVSYLSGNTETYFSTETKMGVGGVINNKSHTGNYSIKAETGFSPIIESTLDFEKTPVTSNDAYVLSIWVHKASNSGVAAPTANDLEVQIIKSGTTTTLSTIPEITQAGDWHQFRYVFNFPITTGVNYNGKITTLIRSKISYSKPPAANSNYLYFDDYRLHPVHAGVSSYVYDDQDRISAILDGNNIGTKYVYDNKGRLKEIWSEKIGTNGGFVKTSEQNMHYKND